MRAFIAISVLDSHHDLGEAINRLLKSPISKDIYIFDLTPNGLDKELKRFVKSYNDLRVFLFRIKRAGKVSSRNERANLGIAESLLKFNSIKSEKYSSYTHIYQGMLFENNDLQILTDSARVYHGLSPVIESYNGIEVLNAMFDRFGMEVYDLEGGSIHFITGQVEESYALNPKCFALSKAYANKLCNFTYSDQDPDRYLNTLVFNNTSFTPKVDTRLFVHEHLY